MGRNINGNTMLSKNLPADSVHSGFLHYMYVLLNKNSMLVFEYRTFHIDHIYFFLRVGSRYVFFV